MGYQTKNQLKGISIFTGLPGSGKSKRLIELVNNARAAQRRVLTFACSDSPWMWLQNSVQVQRILGCRQEGLICDLDHFVSADETQKILERVSPGTLVAFEEAHYFPPDLVPHWAAAARRGVDVLICMPSEQQLRLLREHPHTETKFTIRCERCGQADAETFAVLPGQDATCAMCTDCQRTAVAAVRVELVEQLQRHAPYPGEKTIYQPVELAECAGWRVLRPDSARRGEIMTRLIHEAAVIEDRPANAATYLDVGCNTGYFCHQMSQLGFFAEGVDVVQDDILVAKMLDSYIRRDRVHYVVADAYEYLRDTQNRRFDVTSAFAVFQWLMIQTSVERAVACLQWLFAKSKRLCFLEMGYSVEEQYRNKLPIQIDRAWVEGIMRAKADFTRIQVFEAGQHGLMRDLFVGWKGTVGKTLTVERRSSTLSGGQAEQQSAEPTWEDEEDATYYQGVRDLVTSVAPPEVRVLIVSKGDERLLEKVGRPAEHFPQSETGGYLGYHVSDSAEAITQLEAARCRGAQYLVFPSTSVWWLEEYRAFAHFLEQHCCQVASSPSGIVYALTKPTTADSVPKRRDSKDSDAGTASPSQAERLTFRCNICGHTSTVVMAHLTREERSCTTCGSTMRWRSIIHVLSMELFGKSLALPDFPERPDLAGIGLSDWEGYAQPLSRKLHYRNTYLHCEPKCDIKSINHDLEETLDFVIASDVFEHVAPPVAEAFENLRRLLKPGGVAVFSVPFDKRPKTVEFFPELYDYRLDQADGVRCLRNTTKAGTTQVFKNLAFHGGAGTTLVMRQFSEPDLLATCHKAGFADVKIYAESCPIHGIIWSGDAPPPLALRRAGPTADPEWKNVCTQVLGKASSRTHQGDVVRLLAQLLPRFVNPSSYQRYFRFWEANGFHLTPVHFYQPLPDTRSLPEDLWRTASGCNDLNMNDAEQLDLLCRVFPQYRGEYEKFPLKPTDCPHEFYLDNTRFAGTDALALYCIVRYFQPRLIIEVGSGYSTRLTAQAALRNGKTEFISIEPFPDPVVKAGFPGLTSLIPRRVQEVGLDTFRQLSSGDILFLDSSHVVRCGSDVNYLVLEVLPRLRPGVIVHLHDIFLPKEYPRDWLKQEFRFWNEQYLLQAFLMFNSEFEVLLANNYLAHRYRSQMQATFPTSPWWGGGSFWMRRRLHPEAT